MVSYLFIFTPNWRKSSNFTCGYFWGWVVQPPTGKCGCFSHRGSDQNHKVPPFWCPTSHHDIASRFPKLGLNWRRLRRSHGFRLEDFFGGLKVYFFPCHVIFGVSLTILCSSNCRKQVGSLLCAARWHLFVDTMHC